MTDPYDTGVLPPGDDVGGSTLPDRGQRLNRGFGAGKGDLDRGHLAVEQPSTYDDPHPQRRRDIELLTDPPGFVGRSTYSNER